MVDLNQIKRKVRKKIKKISPSKKYLKCIMTCTHFVFKADAKHVLLVSRFFFFFYWGEKKCLLGFFSTRWFPYQKYCQMKNQIKKKKDFKYLYKYIHHFSHVCLILLNWSNKISNLGVHIIHGKLNNFFFWLHVSPYLGQDDWNL